MPLGIIFLGALYMLSGIFGILWGVAAIGIGSLSFVTGVLLSDTMHLVGLIGGNFNAIFGLIIPGIIFRGEILWQSVLVVGYSY